MVSQTIVSRVYQTMVSLYVQTYETMNSVYSNSSIASLFDYLYRYYISYSMGVDWILHLYRRKIQELYDQPRLLDSHNNGMSNWLRLGQSFYYAYTQQWHMGYS